LIDEHFAAFAFEDIGPGEEAAGVWSVVMVCHAFRRRVQLLFGVL